MRISGTIHDSIVDGPGLRFVVFTQGCTHGCEGCHNPDTHELSGGREVSVDEILKDMFSNPLIDGLTLSGGEPFLQAGECAILAQKAKEQGLSIWCYSGFTFEELLNMSGAEYLLGQIDVLVDGPFVLGQRSLTLKWRGSANQRILDINQSLALGRAVTLAD